ncbi:MAG: 2-iminobutanoate/2-iminopropanoate deaminase [Gammaproteobacteria bacterium]|jgi:2-iminobutanoate/2-iminopropanoate deaminase
MPKKPEYLHLVPELEAQYCFSIGVRAGDNVYIGGLTASDDQGNELFADNAALQMKNIYEQMGRVLRHFGGSASDIVSEVIYYSVSMDEYNNELFPHRQAFYLGGKAPSVAGMQVLGFTSESIKVEVTAVAYLPQ